MKQQETIWGWFIINVFIANCFLRLYWISSVQMNDWLNHMHTRVHSHTGRVRRCKLAFLLGHLKVWSILVPSGHFWGFVPFLWGHWSKPLPDAPACPTWCFFVCVRLTVYIFLPFHSPIAEIPLVFRPRSRQPCRLQINTLLLHQKNWGHPHIIYKKLH